MMKFNSKHILVPMLLGGALTLSLAACPPAYGQGAGGYQITETTSDQIVNNSNAGPVRLARISYVRGNVTWRADSSLEWSQATDNLPVRQGAQIWVQNGGRAEIVFDDGSILRLGNSALVTLKTLYSDAQGEFTQITLNEGLVTLIARQQHSVYQIDSPFVSIKTTGASRVRVGAANGVEIAVQRGSATVEGSQGSAAMHQGDYLDLRSASSSYQVYRQPSEDSWDEWNDTEDQVLTVETSRPSYSYVPSNIGLVAGDLDTYGSWRDDATYGHVWCPRTAAADWRPYHDGHWTWVAPFGWTWVADEPWGWAPYHYGTWVHASYGWGWCPGPAQQYWCPAVVNFSEYDGNVAWCPLAPTEVRYPSALSIGFRSGNWSLFFSIGQAGCYYPNSGGGYCLGRPYSNTYVNHVTYVNNVTNITNIYNNYGATNRRYFVNNRFVSINARAAAGASVATLAAFGGRGAYRALARNQVTVFQHGRAFVAPAGRAGIAGPVSVRPTLAALTPNRTLMHNVNPSRAVLNRAIYHAALPAAITRGVAQAGRPDIRPVSHLAPAGRQPVAQRPLPGNRAPGNPIANARVNRAVVKNGAANVRRPANNSAAIAAAHARASLGMPGGRPVAANSARNATHNRPLPATTVRRPSAPIGSRPSVARNQGARPTQHQGTVHHNAPAANRSVVHSRPSGNFNRQARQQPAPQHRSANAAPRRQYSGGHPAYHVAERPAGRPNGSGRQVAHNFNPSPRPNPGSNTRPAPRPGPANAPRPQGGGRPAGGPRGASPGRQDEHRGQPGRR